MPLFFRRDKDVIGILEDIAEESLESTHFFHTGPEPVSYALNHDPECFFPLFDYLLSLRLTR